MNAGTINPLSRLSSLALVLYAVLTAAFLAALFLPWPDSLSIIPTLTEYVPGWLPLLPVPFVLILLRKRRQLIALLLIALINSAVFLDLQIPLPFGGDEPGLRIRVATYNIGNANLKPARLVAWYKQSGLDALLVQETQSIDPNTKLLGGMNYRCGGRLCVLSHHPIEKLESLNRQSFKGGWGSYIARFDLRLGGESVAVYNVHLNTPRHELEFLRGLLSGVKEASRLYTLRKLESQIASAMVAQHPEQRRHVVVAGDFNLTPKGSIYREYWSDYDNAFSTAGVGMGYTKRTRLLGARIDHILFNDAVSVAKVSVGDGLGGDHRPLTAELILH